MMARNSSPNLNHYLSQFNDACFNRKDGGKLSKMLSLFDMVSSRIGSSIISEFDESLISRHIFSPWDDVVAAHLRSVIAYAQHGDHVEAFAHKCSLNAAFSKALSACKDENWLLPVMYVTAVEMRKLATLADYEKQRRSEDGEGSGDQDQVKPDECLEEATSQLMNLFRICVADVRASMEVTKRKGMINLINQMFKIYFRINKLHLCKPLIRALDNANMMNHFSLAQRVTYSYFTGMKALFDLDFKKAEELLSFSFNNCHPHMFKNQRLILLFLVPVKMLLGHMPSDMLLHKYDLLQFAPIVKAVKQGNIREMDKALECNADFFWNHGIYLILEKLKNIAYRNIFKKVSLILKTHQIPIDNFVSALMFCDNKDITPEEVHCILANLIYEGKIRGYISLQHQKLVISKQNPFPPLASSA